MKKALLIGVVVLILLVIAGFVYYHYANKKQDISKLPEYYQNLAKECESAGSYNCCMSSVNDMKDGNYQLEPETGCPEGYRSEMVMCIDSFKWCEPVK
jgi:hypothetical protein